VYVNTRTAHTPILTCRFDRVRSNIVHNATTLIRPKKAAPEVRKKPEVKALKQAQAQKALEERRK
jgi:hypothetical protein